MLACYPNPVCELYKKINDVLVFEIFPVFNCHANEDPSSLDDELSLIVKNTQKNVYFEVTAI